MDYLKKWGIRVEKVVTVENEEINKIGVFLQYILLVVFIILGICTIFFPSLKFITECFLSGLLGVMGYNNATLFKRKKWTIIYVAVAVFVLISAILGIFHD